MWQLEKMGQKYLDSKKTIYINANKPDKSDIKKAVLILAKGGIVAIPTDTVYGFGACAYNEKAVQRIFKIKNRPDSKPMVLILNNIKDIEKFAKDISENTKQLMKKNWPGPLTLILRAKKNKIYRKLVDILTKKQ